MHGTGARFRPGKAARRNDTSSAVWWGWCGDRRARRGLDDAIGDVDAEPARYSIY